MGSGSAFGEARPLLPPLAARGFSGQEDVLPGRRSPFLQESSTSWPRRGRLRLLV
jgi:hypothetical protein